MILYCKYCQNIIEKKSDDLKEGELIEKICYYCGKKQTFISAGTNW